MPYLILLILCFQLQADILSYSDSQGKKHYVSDIQKVPEQYRNNINQNLPPINRVPARTWAPIPESQSDSSSAYGNKAVLLVTNVCPYCRMAEDYLTKNKIKFEKLDVESNPSGQKLYMQLGSGGVPILKVKDQVVRGYDPASYAEIFKK